MAHAHAARCSPSPSGLLSLSGEAVQQDGLADAAQPPQREILLRTPGSQTLKHHAKAGLLPIPTSELRWRRTGARRIRIQNLVHAPEYIALFDCIWSAHKTA